MSEHNFAASRPPRFKVWKKDPAAILPVQAHSTDVGWDLCNLTSVYMIPDEYRAIRTGLVVQPPPGYYYELVPRSSLFKRHGLLLANSVGIFDPTYCGENDEIHMLVYSTRVVNLEAGTRIAQLIPRRHIQIEMLDQTGTPFSLPDRGGVGSTGE